MSHCCSRCRCLLFARPIQFVGVDYITSLRVTRVLFGRVESGQSRGFAMPLYWDV